MRRVLLFLGLGIVLGAVESSLLAAFGIRGFGLGLLLGLLLHLGVRAGSVDGVIAAAGIGYLWDVFGGTPIGLSVVAAVAVFLFVRFATRAVDVVFGVVVVLAAMAQGVRLLVLTLLVWASPGLDTATGSTLVFGFTFEILLAIVTAPLVYQLARVLDRLVCGLPAEGSEVWLS